ncbi:hypothetical protein GGI35DRAFT_432870 [Trichoderma velutinum]
MHVLSYLIFVSHSHSLLGFELVILSSYLMPSHVHKPQYGTVCHVNSFNPAFPSYFPLCRPFFSSLFRLPEA